MSKRRGLYDEMIALSTEPRWYRWSDGLFTSSQTRPSREELIDDYQIIPIRVMQRRLNGPGYAQDGETTYATREQAERAVSPFAPQITEEAAA
jgi:hypothetical protein